MNTSSKEPTEEQKRFAEHVHQLKAALDKAKQTGESLNLTIGKHKAVFQNGELKFK